MMDWLNWEYPTYCDRSMEVSETSWVCGACRTSQEAYRKTERTRLAMVMRVTRWLPLPVVVKDMFLLVMWNLGKSIRERKGEAL